MMRLFLLISLTSVLGQETMGINPTDCGIQCSANNGLVDGVLCNQGDMSDEETTAYIALRDPANQYCNCEWDLQWQNSTEEDGPPGECVDRCDCEEIDAPDSTAKPPEWDLERSGFISDTAADEIAFAVKISTCYPEVEYAFGDNTQIGDDDWAPWELNENGTVEYIREEDCKISVVHTYTWWQHKNEPLHTVHDDESPLVLAHQTNGTLTRVPLTQSNMDAWLASRDPDSPFTEFIVYDGCLNIREHTTFNLEFDGVEYPIERYVTNVLKFKIEFPLILETCVNVTVDVVEFEDVLVNQTVYCTDSGGFGAKLDFQTFTSPGYYVEEGDDTFDVSMSGVGANCFDLTMSAKDNTENCPDNSDNTCVQGWELDIIPKTTGECDDICTLDGTYTFDVSLASRTEGHPSYDRQFEFTVASADFCTRVIAEAVVTDSMDAYRYSNRTVEADAFFVDSHIYLQAEYDSPDASIENVDQLYFTVKNLDDGTSHFLWQSGAITELGEDVSFVFMDVPLSVDEEPDFNPFYLWPQFIAVASEFGLDGATFPVTLELCLGTNVTFWGNENDGSSGTQNGTSVGPGNGGEGGPELLEMFDRRSSMDIEVKRSIVLLENGMWKYLDDENSDIVGVDAVDYDEDVDREPKENEASDLVLNITIISFLVTILVTIGAYAAFAVLRKKSYEKVATRVPSTRGVLVSA